MEYELQQAVPALHEMSPILSHCWISCVFSLLGWWLWAFRGSPDALAQYVCHYNLLCYLKLKNKHLLPNVFFPSPLEVPIKCHLNSSGIITRTKPPAPKWPRASTWTKIAALSGPKRRKRKTLPFPKKELLNYICHHWGFFLRSYRRWEWKKHMEKEIHFASLKYLWSSTIAWFYSKVKYLQIFQRMAIHHTHTIFPFIK